MKNFLPILLLLVIASCKKEDISNGLTTTFSVRSVSNGATYTMHVAMPEHFNTSKKYATIYVLDGDDNFDFVAARCNAYSESLSSDNVLVVGIGYGNDRTVDYTPTDAPEGDGGAEKFMQFIQTELIPKMENDFGADTTRKSRVILGHSFGGLLGAYAFTNHNEVFGNYILLSPSLWYDNEVMLRLEQEYRDRNKINPQLVFMGLGELENEGRMLAPYNVFFQRLKNNYAGMQITSHLAPHLDHTGSRNPNIEAGLKYYFGHR